MSKYADIKLPNELYQVVENIIVEIPTSIFCLPLKEKFNLMSMMLMILLVNLRKGNLMIRIFCRRRQKSYLPVDKGNTVLFVCPTNRLLHEFEGDAITINNMFGISVGDAKIEPFDYSEFDVTIFD